MTDKECNDCHSNMSIIILYRCDHCHNTEVGSAGHPLPDQPNLPTNYAIPMAHQNSHLHSDRIQNSINYPNYQFVDYDFDNSNDQYLDDYNEESDVENSDFQHQVDNSDFKHQVDNYDFQHQVDNYDSGSQNHNDELDISSSEELVLYITSNV